jgi:hypothetical protein
VIQHKSFDSDTNSLYPAGGHGNPISPIVLPGDGLALLADFRDDDYKAGIVSKHERSPEAVLKLKRNNRVDIWATATLASYSCNAYKDTKLTAASRHGHSLAPKTSSTEEAQTAPSMTVFTLQKGRSTRYSTKETSATRCDWDPCSGIARKAGRGRS